MDIVYIILAVILVVILIILALYNQLIRLHNSVKNFKANIDIYLNKRFDLIPNLVECVKGYSKHESSTLEDIVALRNNYNNSNNLDVNEIGKINDKLNNFLAVMEAYPELKANTQFMNLQKELSRIEDQLESARNSYNFVVTKYNTKIETVPSNIVASMFNFKKAELFTTDQENKENVKINF